MASKKQAGSSSSSSSGPSMKLLVDRKSGRVMFAEADKGAADFLFGLLGLPSSKVINMPTRDPSCRRNLSRSVEAFPDNFICHSDTKAAKDAVLNPTKAAKRLSGGFVKGRSTYMVTDDLKITPMFVIPAITMLSKLGVKDIGTLTPKSVQLGEKEGDKILQTSMVSTTVLTDVFRRASSSKA